MAQELPISLFNRLTVAQPTRVFDSKFVGVNDTFIANFWNREITGTATSTYKSGESLIEMAAGTTSGNAVHHHTTKYFNYVSGAEQQILLTFQLDGMETGLVYEIGLFNETNGIYLKVENNECWIVIKDSITGLEDAVPQKYWNFDKMDGYGPSRIFLDINDNQIFGIKYQWLGVGSVACGFSIDGKFVPVHQFNHANLTQKPYMATPNLPITYKVYRTASGTVDGKLNHICSAVFSEFDGKGSTNGVIRSFALLNAQGKALNTTWTPIFGIRKVNDNASVLINNFDYLSDGNNAVVWGVWVAPTITGGAWVAQGSAVEINSTITSFTGGFLVQSGYTSGQIRAGEIRYDNIATLPNDVPIVLAAQRLGTNATMYASVNWLEVY